MPRVYPDHLHIYVFSQVKEQLAGQMIDILNPGKVSKWKVKNIHKCDMFSLQVW